MSQSLQPKRLPETAAEISVEWIAERRAILQHEGHAIRACASSLTIEIQCINNPDRWLYLGRDGFPLVFATAADRDAILAQLWSHSP